MELKPRMHTNRHEWEGLRESGRISRTARGAAGLAGFRLMMERDLSSLVSIRVHSWLNSIFQGKDVSMSGHD